MLAGGFRVFARTTFAAACAAAICAMAGCVVASPRAPSAAPRAPSPPHDTPAEEKASAPAEAESEAAPQRADSDCDEAPASDDIDEGGEHAIDDGFERPEEPSAGTTAPLPFADMTDAEITARLRTDIGALGPISIGPAHSGVLIAGIRMQEGANWYLASPGLSWGTAGTIAALSRAIDAVAERFPDTPNTADTSRRTSATSPGATSTSAIT
jgi:hypothetical protein